MFIMVLNIRVLVNKMPTIPLGDPRNIGGTYFSRYQASSTGAPASQYVMLTSANDVQFTHDLEFSTPVTVSGTEILSLPQQVAPANETSLAVVVEVSDGSFHLDRLTIDSTGSAKLYSDFYLGSAAWSVAKVHLCGCSYNLAQNHYVEI